MGNWNCNLQDAAHVAAVARGFCPFPDYSPSPLLQMLSANSSVLLSERYAIVQASLTLRQQQDFTQTLRSTFGRQEKVSYGGVGVVALSLAVLFDTVARQVKGQHVSDHEPIPGLFLTDPRGTYSAPVYTVSRYLRLVPYIANNPSRMRQETEKYLHELNHTAVHAMGAAQAALQFEDIAGLNAVTYSSVGNSMMLYLKHISNTTIDPKDFLQRTSKAEPNIVLNLNCDPEEASDRFLTELDSFDNRTKEALKNCKLHQKKKTIMKDIAELEWFFTVMSVTFGSEIELEPAQLEDFELKAKALGNWT